MVTTALEIVDREGVRQMTIRQIADAMSVPPMSLYSCFTSKSELLDYMYAEVAGRLFAGVESTDWREGLRSVGRSLRTMLGEHPSWAPLFSRPAPPLVSPAREHLLGKLIAAGMSAEQAFTALSSVILGSLGLMLVELALRDSGAKTSLEERLESLKQAVAEEPDQAMTQQALARLEQYSLGAVHEHSLEMLLVGFESWTRR